MTFLLLTTIRQDGVIALEKDILNPQSSNLFNTYPRRASDPILMEYLRLVIGSNMNACGREALMDEEIETCEYENEIAANVLHTAADALPTFVIFATVMVIINVLADKNRPMVDVGEPIAHAWGGTFLAIFLAYGFVLSLAPLRRKMLQCSKVTRLARLQGYVSRLAVALGRKSLFSTERLSLSEREKHLRMASMSASGAILDSHV